GRPATGGRAEAAAADARVTRSGRTGVSISRTRVGATRSAIGGGEGSREERSLPPPRGKTNTRAAAPQRRERMRRSPHPPPPPNRPHPTAPKERPGHATAPRGR